MNLPPEIKKHIANFDFHLIRDVEKLKRAEKKGITIVTIKYDEPITNENILMRIKEADK